MKSNVSWNRVAQSAVVVAAFFPFVAQPAAQAATVPLVTRPATVFSVSPTRTDLHLLGQGKVCGDNGNTCNRVVYRPMDDPSGIAALQRAISSSESATGATGSIVVFGYSEGATVVAKWLAEHQNDPDIPAPSRMTIVVMGNPTRAGTGITVPNDLTFPDSPYQVLDVARQYDGVADYPNNPASPYYWLAVRNATRGTLVGHLHNYATVDPYDSANAVWTSADGNTTYVLVPTEYVPLLGGFGRMFPEWNAKLKAEIETAYIRPVPFPTQPTTPVPPTSSAQSVGAATPLPATPAVTTSSSHRNTADLASLESEVASTGSAQKSEGEPSGATETEATVASTSDKKDATSPSGGVQAPSGTSSSSTSGQSRRPLLNRLRTSLGLKPAGDRARAGRSATGSASDRGVSHSADE